MNLWGRGQEMGGDGWRGRRTTQGATQAIGTVSYLPVFNICDMEYVLSWGHFFWVHGYVSISKICDCKLSVLLLWSLTLSQPHAL